ncbi:MAG: UMP kinase [Clostridiales bacterium]|nr:UMP kinase [Clostridiales bacterium]
MWRVHPKPVYKRVLLKISGEALAGQRRFGIDQATLDSICADIKRVADEGVQIGIVCGGGNYWRGRDFPAMERTRADHAGMLATVINGLALQDCLLALGAEARLQTAIEMRTIAEFYTRSRAITHLERGCIMIFAAGTGNPYFSTDTAAALRAAEINADAILLAKRIDGIYTDDPEKNGDARFIEQISYIEVLNRRLGVMDATATSLCMDNNIPIVVFGISDPNNILRVVRGERIGSIVCENPVLQT